MDEITFRSTMEMLRSPVAEHYEDAYFLLQGDSLHQYVSEIAALVESEIDPIIRARYVELVGDADLSRYIPLLVRELHNGCEDVRSWAWTQLYESQHETARKAAKEYQLTHPDEGFYNP
jgi:hypothetical protein